MATVPPILSIARLARVINALWTEQHLRRLKSSGSYKAKSSSEINRIRIILFCALTKNESTSLSTYVSMIASSSARATAMDFLSELSRPSVSINVSYESPVSSCSVCNCFEVI